MRMQILKIVVVLLVAGSGDTRPQNGADSAMQAEKKESNVGWRGVRASNKSQDIVRDDSRYTGTSGSNRKSYVTYFRDNVDSSREHNAPGSRTSGLAPNGMTRLFSARRSKINDIWLKPEFKATDALDFSRTNVLDEIREIGANRNLSEVGRPSFQGSSSNSGMIHDEKMGWVRSVLTSNRSSDLGSGRKNHSEKLITKNLEGWKSDAILNQNFRSMVTQMRYSPVGNDFLANRASGFDRTNNNISSAIKNRQKSDSIRSNLFSNKDIRGNVSRRKAEQNISSSQIVRTNVPSNFQEGASTHFIRKSHNSIRKHADRTDLTATSYENLKPSAATDSFRRVDGLNNSGKSSYGVETRSTPIPNSKSGIAGHSRFASRKNAVTSNRNFVKLRYPFSTSNRRNASNIALNTKLKNNNVRPSAVQLTESTKHHFAQTAAKRPDLNDHVMFESTKNSHSSHSQNLPSQADSVGAGNETRDEDGATSAQHNVYFKNWPNEALQDIEDLYNYEKYTSTLETNSNHDSGLQNAGGMPILSSDGDYFNHPDPILDSSVKKIIHWLKIPAIVPNGTHFVNNNEYDVHKPVESVLESIYENFEPNRPLNINAHDSNYETVVLQNAAQNQDFDRLDYHGNYPNRWPHPSSVVRPQYITDSSNPSILTPSSWSDVTLLKNKTVYNPLTHVTQNTVVHILNDDLKKPNVTATQLKVPESNQTASSGSSSELSSEGVQKPNVHVTFTSQNEKNKGPPKQEINTSPSSTHNTNCPTILINTYTRVNNTIQSKEGCTNLNIVVNSHVTSTNVFEPSDGSIGGDQQTSLATQSYGDAIGSDKYAEGIDDLAHQDSLNSYVTASTGTYGPSPLETPRPAESDYYDPQKDPAGFPGNEKDPFSGSSTVEVFQGTQISVSGSNIPLTDDAEATTGPVLAGADGPVGSSVDGPAVGDDASSSAIDPSAGGTSVSGSPVAGNPSSINSPISANVPSVAQELPVYLVKPGPIKGQANNGLIPGSLQLPSLSNLPSRPSLAVKPGLPSVSSLSSATSSLDDDDDDFDMSPGGLLQSIASVFTYFTFLNPLGYSFFSLAAAPFAAMAAGVLGVAAVIFPWALPNVLDFGRAADKVTIRFRPNLEEFVRQAVHKYDRLNEWKSRRRKRRR